MRWLWRHLTGRTCFDGKRWVRHEPGWFDPWSLLTDCTRCGDLF